MDLSELDTSHRFFARVVSTERLTPASQEEVRELTLDLDRHVPDLGVGKSVGVLAPGLEEFGQDHHLRLYSVADLLDADDKGHSRIRIAVKRCSYIDEYSGERYDGVASNYLCDLSVGDTITMTGPFGLPFTVPRENDANLILIATSTGIAPFRAFVRHLFEKVHFEGRIWLYYGAKTGLDMVYLNDERDDFAQYYDRETFEAFKALSPRPHFGDAIDWSKAMGERRQALWAMLEDPKTYVYVAGLREVRDQLYDAFKALADSPDQWERRKAEMMAGHRWVELVY